jgi:leader peptidase (prepilin peptidase)/N-methyltransferase
VTALGSPELADWGLIAAAPVIGSFLGVVIRRLPAGRPVLWGRSRCEQCAAALDARDLLPFVSWLATGGACRHCRASIGGFYPAVEAAALAVAVVSVVADGGSAARLDALLGWWLLALGWIDLRDGILPDVLTLPLAAAGLAAAWWLAPTELIDRCLGVAGGYVLLWMVAFAYRRWRDREGLGLGDAKLLAAVGAWVGASGLPTVLAGGAIAALAAALVLRVAGRAIDRHTAMPFGPALAAAAWLTWLYGPLGV